MTLSEFEAQLQKLINEGHGEKEVFYRHGASGDCGPLGSAYITDEVDDDTGPFDFGGAEYVSIYAGN